jgi:ribosomal subunit interface protein
MKLNTVGPISVESTIMLGASLKQHIQERIEGAISKTFNSMLSATVHFKEEGASFLCTIKINAGGMTAYGEFKGADCYKAFNGALDKAFVQLRKGKATQREDKPVRTDKDMILRDGLREPSYDDA